MATVLWVTGSYQLGDDPGLFQDALYVGHSLELPFRKTWIDPLATTIKLIFKTHDIETWGAWQGHAVMINGVEVGRLKDPDDVSGGIERFEISIPRKIFDNALGGSDDFLLRIGLETQPAQHGLSDDFVLKRIESDESVAAKLGWK